MDWTGKTSRKNEEFKNTKKINNKINKNKNKNEEFKKKKNRQMKEWKRESCTAPAQQYEKNRITYVEKQSR